MITVPPADRGPVDMHVHLVGNGLTGSGCWLRPPFLHRFLADWMLRQLGMTVSWRAAGFDEAYVELLVRWLRESPLTHAVLLAHEEVYDAGGRKLAVGSMLTSRLKVLTTQQQLELLLLRLICLPLQVQLRSH